MAKTLPRYIGWWTLMSATIHRRFNKPAAAVRARMAQKCKDERRFGRLPNSNGNSYIDGNFDTNVPSPVAAISSCRSGTRKARKRPANSTSTSSSSHSLNGGNVKQSCTQNYNIYQRNIINDDGCSSTTDSNQLPPISLSPNGVSLSGGAISDDVNGDFDCILQTSIDDSFSVLNNHSDMFTNELAKMEISDCECQAKKLKLSVQVSSLC
ncbi:BEN domain [Schistosoma japonicum]|nr:BEN domain [Schistosoma japonicum]